MSCSSSPISDARRSTACASSSISFPLMAYHFERLSASLAAACSFVASRCQNAQPTVDEERGAFNSEV